MRKMRKMKSIMMALCTLNCHKHTRTDIHTHDNSHAPTELNPIAFITITTNECNANQLILLRLTVYVCELAASATR